MDTESKQIDITGMALGNTIVTIHQGDTTLATIAVEVVAAEPEYIKETDVVTMGFYANPEGTGDQMTALTVGVPAWLVIRAEDLEADRYLRVMTGGDATYEEFETASIDKVILSDVGFLALPFTLTAAGSSATVMLMDDSYTQMVGIYSFPTNDTVETVTAINFNLPSPIVSSDTLPWSGATITPSYVVASAANDYVPTDVKFEINSTSGAWSLEENGFNGAPSRTLTQTGMITTSEDVFVTITAGGFSATQSMSVDAKLTSATITSAATYEADGAGEVMEQMTFTTDPTGADPRLITWTIDSGSATITPTTGILTASGVTEPRDIVVQLNVSGTIVTKTITLTPAA